jgi:hypothetical protein
LQRAGGKVTAWIYDSDKTQGPNLAKFMENRDGQLTHYTGTGKFIPPFTEQAAATDDASGRAIGRAAYERSIGAFAATGLRGRDIAERWRGLSDHWRANEVKWFPNWITKGDVTGHPFRGNQYTQEQGQGGSAAVATPPRTSPQSWEAPKGHPSLTPDLYCAILSNMTDAEQQDMVRRLGQWKDRGQRPDLSDLGRQRLYLQEFRNLHQEDPRFATVPVRFLPQTATPPGSNTNDAGHQAVTPAPSVHTPTPAHSPIRSDDYSAIENAMNQRERRELKQRLDERRNSRFAVPRNSDGPVAGNAKALMAGAVTRLV